MSYLKSIVLKLSCIISLSIFLHSCSWIIPPYNEYISPLQLNQNDDTPKSVVIMPFSNETPEKGIEILARTSFYNHFSSKNYRDFELSEVDRGLEILYNNSSTSWKEIPPSNIGKFFHTDYIIYGRVKEFKKIFLGIYAQIVLTVEVKIFNGGNGDIVWIKTVTKRSHEGGIPFNPFGIIPAALRSGLHMKDDKTIALVDKVNRDLAAQIPEPPSPQVTPYFVEIQVASFLENKLAQKTLQEFEGKGFNPRIETVKLGDHLWHRIILGPYYNLPEAEKVRDRVAQNTQFQPIFIHHYPETQKKQDITN